MGEVTEPLLSSSDSDESDSSDDENGSEKATIRAFRQVFDEVNKVDFKSDSQIQAFASKFAHTFERKHKVHGTLLHYMTEEPITLGCPRHRLLKLLLQDWPQLLIEQDSEKNGPLHLALQKKKRRREFVETVLECGRDDIVTKAIGLCNDRDDNCLHQAIKIEFRSTKQLILKCHQDILVKKNKDQQTPLHMAMELVVSSRHKPAGARDSNAFQSDPAQVKGKESSSPKEFLARNDDLLVGVGKAKYAQGKNEDPTANISKLVKRGSALQGHVNDSVGGGANHTVETMAFKSKQRRAFDLQEIVEGLISRNGKSMSEKNGKGFTPYQYRLHVIKEKPSKFSAYKTQQQQGGESTSEMAIEDDPIARYMKYYCLRNMDRKEAIEVLYEKGKGIDPYLISFSFIFLFLLLFSSPFLFGHVYSCPCLFLFPFLHCFHRVWCIEFDQLINNILRAAY
jgi:hypothetical protein